jgi:protocatechuate 3,4-dioxygenase beta subunit
MPMDNDDALVGRVLTRREAVVLLTAASAGLLTGCANGDARAGTTGGDSAAGDAIGPAMGTPTPVTAGVAAPSCVVQPEMTEGPYFLDKQLVRSDIRAEPTTGVLRAGAPLVLTFAVTSVSGGQCTPLSGALVDLWHCDAAGEYSGFTDTMQGFRTEGLRFLRGQQVTDASGAARFSTIYPGWYAGRAVHLHFKIRAAVPGAAASTYEFTSQLFFDESLTDKVHANAPYAAKGRRTLMNSGDGIFQSAGEQMVLALADASGSYTSTFAIGMDLTNAATGRADGGGGMGGPPPGGRPPGGRPPGGRPPGPPPRRPPAA